MKKLSAAVAATAMLFATACGASTEEVWEERGGEADAICVDKDTKERVEESKCESASSSGSNNWILWYLLANQMAPRYGQPAQYGQPQIPPGYTVHKNRVPRTGGVVKAKPAQRYQTNRPVQKPKWDTYNPNKKSGVPDSKPRNQNQSKPGGYKPPTGGGYKPAAPKPYNPPPRYK